MLFGNFESNDEAFHATDAQNLMIRLSHYDVIDLTSRQLRLRAQVSSGEMVEWIASLSVHLCDDKTLVASVDWTTRRVVTPLKGQARCGPCGSFSLQDHSKCASPTTLCL